MKKENDDTTRGNIVASLGVSLLDSRLIRQTDKILYNAKFYQCGEYIQLYLYEETRIKRDKNFCSEKNEIYKKKIIVDEKNNSNTTTYKEIRYDNALRSKLSLQRLVKANSNVFRTFITLTFEDNVSNINEANKLFNSWRTRTKKLFKNFEYVSVPELQKRGAVHYHMLTNIDYNNSLLVNQDIKKIWQPKSNQWQIFKTLNHWHIGFSSVKNVIDDDFGQDIVSYISKYVTKDVDKRLYNRKRYSYSKSLLLPKPFYFHTEDKSIIEYVNNLLISKDVKYHSTYKNKISNSKIDFLEFITN